MDQRPTRRISAESLRDLMERLLVAAGSNAAQAAVAAEIFLEADLRGHSIQGLDHMWTTLSELRSGLIKGDARPRVVRARAATVLVDGDSATGQLAGVVAADAAVANARKAGAATVGIVNAADLFMLGYYAERIARAGHVGLVFTNTSPRVHPYGGVDKVLGTNPLAIGVPTANAHPFVFDAALSASAVGHLRIAGYHSEDIAAGIAVDERGGPTLNPTEGIKGAIAPFGGHKGFGLGLAVALLSGPMVGGLIGSALREAAGWHGSITANRGHLMIAVDPAAFGDPEAFPAAVTAYLEEVKGSRKVPGVDAIRVPGERAFAARERSLRDGVVLYEAVWEKTRKLAAELGVEMPD